jgi:predicted Zn-dependent protease
VFYEQFVLPNVTSDPIFALTVLADGLRHQPDRRLWEMAGPIMDQVAQMPQGEQILIQLVHDFPNHPAPSAMLARHYIIQGQPEKAASIIEDLRQKFPDDAATAFVYADYLASTGDVEGAIREFEAILANPNTPPFVRRVAERRINELKGTPGP